MSRAERTRRLPAFGWLLFVVIAAMLAVVIPRGLYDAYAAGKGGGAARSHYDSSSFTISGAIATPLWLGDSVPVDLTFTNPHGYPITASHITVSIGSVQASGADLAHPCSTADFTIRQIAGDATVTIPAHGQTALSLVGMAQTSWPTIGLIDLPTNQDGCQGASVILDFTADGSPR